MYIIILMQEMTIRQYLKIYEAKMLTKCHTKMLVYFTTSYSAFHHLALEIK